MWTLKEDLEVIFAAGAVLWTLKGKFSRQAPCFVDLEVQKAQRFVDLEVQNSWPAVNHHPPPLSPPSRL